MYSICLSLLADFVFLPFVVDPLLLKLWHLLGLQPLHPLALADFLRLVGVGGVQQTLVVNGEKEGVIF